MIILYLTFLFITNVFVIQIKIILWVLKHQKYLYYILSMNNYNSISILFILYKYNKIYLILYN